MENWVGTKQIVFRSIYNAPTLFWNIQEVLNMQRVWYSPNMVPNMVHSQALLINSSSATWGCAEQLCGYKPWDPSPVSSKNTKKTTGLCHQLL